MPAYSTDKGFTGSAGGMGGGGGTNGTGSDKEKKKKEQAELTTKERNLNALDALRGGKPQNLDPATGKAIGPKDPGTKSSSQLPPGLNPLKYSSNPNIQYEATPRNIATLVGNIVTGKYTSPLGMISEVIGAEETTGLTKEIGDALGLGGGFEGPSTPIGGADYDRSEVTNAATGLTTSTFGTNKPTAKSKSNKKPPKPGFTLLKGVGGTLIGT